MAKSTAGLNVPHPYCRNPARHTAHAHITASNPRAGVSVAFIAPPARLIAACKSHVVAISQTTDSGGHKETQIG